MAASQCPSCGHLFEVRDGFGDMLPLSFCTACDSYYPAQVGSCKWCGTTPEPPPNTSRLWKIVGAVAVVGLAGVTWLLRDAGDTPAAKIEQQAERVVQPPPAPVAVAPATSVAASAPNAEPVVSPVVSSIESTPSVDSSAGAPAPTKARAPVSRWVNTVAKDWAVVRAGPSKETRIVASVGPGARVQLGEAQGTWRRIRARGIAGWVEPRTSFAAVAPSSARARTVVSR
jgi:hypothetical protein